MSSRNHRPGTTLIETLIYISIAAIVLPLVLTTTIHAFRASGAVREQSENVSSLERLARRFRDDVHEATDVAAAQNARQLVLTLPGKRRVTYQASATAFERTVTAGKATQEHDTFLFSRLAPAGIEFHTDPAEAVLRLRVVLDGQEQADATGRMFDVRARVARDHRFERGE